MVLKTMLEAEGHRVGGDMPELVFCDDLADAESLAQETPVIVLVHATQLADAVRAMRGGVYGYILIPFLPGEAPMMVHRALASDVPTQRQEMRSLSDAERDHILSVMRACKNNQAEAARVLGIARNTLWRKLKAYGMHRNPLENSS